MHRSLVLILTLGVLFFSSGCTRFYRYVGSFGAAGAAVGGVTGAATSASINAGEGALAGGVGGGLVGAVVADNFDDKDWAGMEAEIARLNAENADKMSALAAQQQLLDERDRMLADAQANLDAERNRLAALEGDLNDNAVKLAGLNDSLAAKDRELQDLQDQLGDAVRVGGANGHPDGAITLTILDDILFNAGSAKLTRDGEGILSSVVSAVHQAYPTRSLVVEGHTDAQPIKKSGWKSNWELGAARSLAVLHFMVDHAGMEPHKMSAMTMADTQPVGDNGTPSGRAQNRRAVIVIMPETTMNRVWADQNALTTAAVQAAVPAYPVATSMPVEEATAAPAAMETTDVASVDNMVPVQP